MTIEEMNNIIDGYCETVNSCEECVIRELCSSVGGDFAKEGEIREAAYMLIKGRGLSNGNNVDHPAHYQGKHECIDEMIALFGVEAVKHFCMCNVYKYRFRAANKNGQEDLDKADWYMDKLMELEKGNV